jgi:outer membrane protein assembly factor BamB
VIVALIWLSIKLPSWLVPGTMIQFMGMFWGPMVGAALLAIWWLFFSRLPWADRFVVLLACTVIGAASYAGYHSTFGFFGLIIYALPTALTAWVGWLVLTPFLRWPVRRAGLIAVLVLAWGFFDLLRFEGVTGDFSAELAFRWTPTAEEKFLADERAGKLAGQDSSGGQPAMLQPGDWPGFRGPDRDSRLTGVRIATDWGQHPPRQLWRHRIGPGWSSFAVVGTRLYTQEQRDQDEAVVCYDVNSGGQLWEHRDPVRFLETVSGAGPRATPTFHDGKIYALGAKGQLNCLDATTGKSIWTRDIVADSGASVPTWGFSASPLVVADLVTVFAGAGEGKSVLAYRAVAGGDPAWSSGEGKASYCSLHRAKLGGVEQLLMVTEHGLTSFDPAQGKVLWKHDWALADGMARVTQPALVGETDVLIGTGFGNGTQRVHIQHEGNDWTTQEVWKTRAISPYFNDLVVYQDHLYGFDNNFFTCVSLEDGKRKWRERGYGNGQVLLLADQGLLLILSEQGEVALVEASPDGHKELGRFQAIEGKTWNHPVVAHGKLFVRNGVEAACYELVEQRVASRQ